METTKDYYEKIMQAYNQNGNGRSLSKYCREEGIDYQWLLKYKVRYPHDIKKEKESNQDETGQQSFIQLKLEEKPKDVPQWCIAKLVIESSNGDKLEISSNNLYAVSELLNKMS